MAFSLPTGIDTASRGIRVVPSNAIGKYAGLHMHFPTLADLNAAVGTVVPPAGERGNIAANNPMWAAGQVFTVGTEPSGVHRVWHLSTGGTAQQNGDNSHARSVVLPSGATVILGLNTSVVSLTSGAPTGGAEGDLALDIANNLRYVRGASAWSAGVAIFPGSGGAAVPVAYDPPTDNPQNMPVLFTRADNVVSVTTVIAKLFVAGTYHYNINLNAAGQCVSISAWGAGATGLVGGY